LSASSALAEYWQPWLAVIYPASAGFKQPHQFISNLGYVKGYSLAVPRRYVGGYSQL